MTLNPWQAYELMVFAYNRGRWLGAYCAAVALLEFLKTDGRYLLKDKQKAIAKEIEVQSKRRMIESGIPETLE